MSFIVEKHSSGSSMLLCSAILILYQYPGIHGWRTRWQ